MTDSFYTDCTKVKKSDIEKVVKEKLGLGIDDVVTDEIGVYLPEYDAFYFECGDTNYIKFTCISGSVENNIYTITCKSDLEFYSKVETVLEKTDDGFRFISNKCLDN